MKVVFLDGRTLGADGNSWAALEQVDDVETNELLAHRHRAGATIPGQSRKHRITGAVSARRP